MRSRPCRTRRPSASSGSAPISGTVQIGGLALASCAELVGTPRPSGHPNSHKDASAATPMATRERAKSMNRLQPLHGCRGQDARPSTKAPGAFVHELFLIPGDFPLLSRASRGSMVQRVATVAFEGIEARAVDVQVQVAPGLPAFNIVGLPDKAVTEAKERVRAALVASGLALPARRITVNLAPADLPKEGSHYDLPIALGLMAAIGAIPPDALDGYTVLGELPQRRHDLPGGLRRRGRLGEPRDGDHCAWFADPARQSFQGHAGALAPAGQGARDRRRAARSQRHQGPGERQA